MTNREALKIIKIEMPYENGVINEALKAVNNALEKQIPKKPVFCKVYLCPCCKKQVFKKFDDDFVVGRIPYHCDNCGQALDWRR